MSTNGVNGHQLRDHSPTAPVTRDVCQLRAEVDQLKAELSKLAAQVAELGTIRNPWRRITIPDAAELFWK